MSINNLNTYLNIKDSHLRVVSGNVYAQAMNIGGINVETAHGLQSVSDTGNVTSNTLQFSNAITGFVTTANAQIGRDLVVSGNTTVSTDLTVSANATVADTLTISEHLIASKEATITGNLHVTTIRSDSNVVTEYTGPHDRPLRKYPEVAMTANDNSSTSGYVASTSDVSGTDTSLRHVYTLFDHRVPDGTVTDGWMPGGGYNSVTGIANNSEIRFTGDPGEWVELQLPNSIKLTKFNLKPGGDNNNLSFAQRRFPKIIVIYGYNGTSWGKIQEYTTSTIQSLTDVQTFHISNPTTYHNKFVLIVKQTYSSGGAASSTTNIGEWELYGYEEGSGSLDTTLKTVYNVPATTGTQLEVYYDAKGESTVQSPIPDLSPNTNTGAVSGHSPTLDSTDGIDSFKFNGSSQYVTGAHGLTTGSGPVHTISLWLNATEMTNYTYAVQLGQGGTSHQQSAIMFYENKISHVHWGSGVLSDITIAKNVWYHVVAVFTGGNGSDLSKHKIFINGEDGRVGPFPGSTDGPVVLTGTQLTLGRKEHAGGTPGDYFNGSIANFRLYSKALNAEQIKELYDYQKDYFLGSKSQVTLYKGHLGVGVTEPSGQLELAGDERIQEYPPRDLYQYETLVEGHGVFCASASIEFNDDNHPPWEAFSDSATSASQESVWTTDGALYHTTSGLYTGSTTTAGIKGEWIQLKTPYKIKVSSFNLNSYAVSVNSNRQPKDFTLLGSSDGNDWEQMKSVAGQAKSGYTGVPSTYSGPLGPHHTVNSTKYYSYFRIVVTANQGGDALVGISRIRFFGTPGPTTLDKGSLTLGRSLDVPRISRYDVDTETPRPEKLVVDFDTTVNSSPTDISGQGNHGAFVGTAQYSAPDKAFKFDGNSDYIQTTPLGFSGDQVHSVSLWFWSDVEQSTFGTNEHALWGTGGVSNSTETGFSMYNTFVQVWRAGGATKYPMTFNANQWNHICMAYSSGGSVNSRLWLNGVELAQDSSVTSTSAYSFQASEYLLLGTWINNTTPNTSYPWDGKISNFKLYNVALEPSEVQKLYRLGRTGRFMVISDTAVGIGKVPEAQLDVRGDLRVGGRLLASVPYYSARQRDTNSYVFDESIVYDQYVYTNYPGSFVANSGTDGYYQPPMNGMYQVHMECIIQGEGNIIIQRLTNGTTDISHDNRHYNYTHSGWMAANADTLIPITNHTTQTIRIYIDGSTGNGAWAYASYHGSAFFLWVSDIPERRQHHVA